MRRWACGAWLGCAFLVWCSFSLADGAVFTARSTDYLLGIFIYSMLRTMAIAYVILKMLLSKQLQQSRMVGLVIASIVTGLLVFAFPTLSEMLAIEWAGWLFGMGIMAWRTIQRPNHESDGQETRTSS